MANYIEITCKTACNKINSKSRLPYSWDLNIYRGCLHECKYCYALYSHRYMDSINYFEDIYIKTNIVEQLEKQLRSRSWKKEVINMGGVTDSYQPIEAKYKIMPEILKLMIKYKNPCIISTKSDLILRDFELIEELANITYVNIATTITSMDENIRKKIEPKGSPSLDRFDIIKELKYTNASLGVHFMPIIPYITDTESNIDSIYSKASEVGANYVLPGTLNLRGPTRSFFLKFIKEEYPNLLKPMENMYNSSCLRREYRNNLYKLIDKIKSKYNVSGNYLKFLSERIPQSINEQLNFLDNK